MLGENVKHGLQCSADGSCILISHKAMAVTMTGDIGITPGYVDLLLLLLMLCGDVESNPGPSTIEVDGRVDHEIGAFTWY